MVCFIFILFRIIFRIFINLIIDDDEEEIYRPNIGGDNSSNLQNVIFENVINNANNIIW